jgi:hypothetical protein
MTPEQRQQIEAVVVALNAVDGAWGWVDGAGGPWAIEDRDSEWGGGRWLIVRRPDGASFYVEVEGSRYRVGGRYPRPEGGGSDYVPYGIERPGAAMTQSKAPDQIARDIARRFLPAYLSLYATCQARKAQDEAARADAAAVAGRLSTVLGVRSREDRVNQPGDRHTFYLYTLPGSAHGTVEVSYGGSVKIELSGVPETMAVALCEVIRAWTPETKKPLDTEN